MWSLALEFLACALVSAAVVAWWVRHGERQRIRGEVERRGGELLQITAHAERGAPWRGERAYAVRFRTPEGRIVRAICTSSLLGGVNATSEWVESEWIADSAGEGRTAAEALQEPSLCLACGAEIPARKSRCPRCGWSYRDA